MAPDSTQPTAEPTPEDLHLMHLSNETSEAFLRLLTAISESSYAHTHPLPLLMFTTQLGLMSLVEELAVAMGADTILLDDETFTGILHDRERASDN